MKIEIHTLRYGSPDWLAVCAPTLEAWCSRHALPLSVWSEWNPDYPDPKFVEIDMLRSFLAGPSDRMMYVDADIFIHPNAPLPEFETAGFCVARDKLPLWKRWHQWMDRHFPADDRTGWLYRNAGVWIVDRARAQAFLALCQPPYIKGIMEQNQFNLWWLRAWRAGLPFYDLPLEWNVQTEDQDGWFFHFTGKHKLKQLATHRRLGHLPYLWKPAVPSPDPPLHDRAIVIPWRRHSARWEELRYAVRSIHEHFTDRDCPIYILSDTPPTEFFDFTHPAAGRLRHLPCAAYADCLITGTQLAENVLWFNDDICLLRDCGWEDFRVAWTMGEEKREKSLANCRASNSWRRNHGLVCMDFRHHGQAPHNFSTHTPYLFTRSRSAAVLARFGAFHKLAFETAYHNLHRTPSAPLASQKTRDPSSATALILNYHDGDLTQSFKTSLMNRFPLPLPYEKPPCVVPAFFDFKPYGFTLDDSSHAMDLLHIQLLHRLACHPDIRTAVEIGCYRGASTSALIQAVNSGELDHLHLVEIKPTDTLRHVIALCRFPERVTLHTRPYWETEIGRTDLVFIDGDHRWPVFAEALRALSWRSPVIAMHDSRSREFQKGCWGAGMVSEYLSTMDGRTHWEDALDRPGMATRRGFFVSAAPPYDLAFMHAALSETNPPP